MFRCSLFLPLAAACSLTAAPAWAQKKPAEETPLSRCMAENRQAVIDLGTALEAARRKHVINPMTITRLQSVQAQLPKLRESLPRGARSVADCEQVALAIATEKDKLQRIAGTEPDAAPGDLPVAAVTSGGGRTVTPDVAPAPPSPPVAPPVAPAPPAPPAPPAMTPDACRDTQARQYNELAQSFAAVAQAGALPAERLPLFQSLSERLSKLRGVIVDRNAPGWDCQQVLQGLAQVKTELQPLLPKPK